jgi:CRP-like cAMP-binding protein
MSPASPANLESIPLFASLSAPERAELSEWFELREVKPETRLVREGTTGNSFFVILDGAAAVTSGGERLGTFGAGDFFGEMALLGAGRRAATVTTTTTTRVLVLFAPDFRRLESRHPEVAATLETAMRQRLAES